MKDIFDIQSDVAQKIATTLKAKISPVEKERLQTKPTENLTAYDYYLKGREYYYRYRKEDNEQAIELFKKALELDPDYARAYAGLGDAYGQRVGKFGFAHNWVDLAIDVSQKAISIDPGCVEAYKALGFVYISKGWLHKALQANKKAVELNPNYAPAVGNIGWIDWYIGEYEAALKWMEKALALDPTGAHGYYNVGCVYYGLQHDVKAELWLNKALEFQPDFLYAYEILIYICLGQGKFDQAIAYGRKILSIAPDDVYALIWAGDAEVFSGNYSQAKQYYEKAMEISSPGFTSMSLNQTIRLTYIYWKTDQREKARKMFSQSLDFCLRRLEQKDEGFWIPFDIAVINAIQGKKKEAYLWLQRAIDGGWREYRLASVDPLLENLHSEEQFKRMMTKVKAMVDEMRKQVEETEKK